MTAVQETWDALAPAYDQLTGFHDHAAWAEQVEALARAAGLSGDRLLDAGCGTGSSTAAMRARGYDVVGVDVSPAMLERARARLGPEVPLLRHDLRSLPRVGEFDVVWCVSDGLNFLLSEPELRAALRGFRRNLREGGLAVFDVDTLAAFRKLYTSLLVVPGPDRIVVFEGRAGADELGPGSVAEASVDALVPKSWPWWERVRAIHRQCHHPPVTIEAALAAEGFQLLAVWGTDGAGGSEQPLDEARHNKAVYIAEARG
ncbi:class I SAM-dependent DNA methyltransferase [Solirubrobacter soli]|uniref:class I SAM-dependent DNA methyltransferase n=1 Tax=Solirubrobacter soli TaxID=363832 RepID=UPI0004156145|nr:class I SAM-dependent methyltransferase [Solirubrobacter soli]